MKIDEAIKRFSDNAEYERSHGNLQGCLEFRQLAEWLAELKHLREQTEPCGDTISRRAAVSVANDFDCRMVVRGLEKLHSVHPEQKVGTWITLKDEYGDVVEAVCSKCGRNGSHNWKYCPNCGNKKIEEGEGGMTKEEMIEQIENTILLIKQNGKDWWDERDIPILEEAIKAMKNDVKR